MGNEILIQIINVCLEEQNLSWTVLLAKYVNEIIVEININLIKEFEVYNLDFDLF